MSDCVWSWRLFGEVKVGPWTYLPQRRNVRAGAILFSDLHRCTGLAQSTIGIMKGNSVDMTFSMKMLLKFILVWSVGLFQVEDNVPVRILVKSQYNLFFEQVDEGSNLL